MNAIHIQVGQLGIDYIVDGSATASLGMFELTVPPGSNVPPPHSHSNNEECVYVLAGTLRYSWWRFALACFLGKAIKFLIAALIGVEVAQHGLRWGLGG